MGGGNYMLLRPERSTLSDLVALLIFPSVGQCTYLDCSQPMRRNFRYRFTIFSSLLFQKFFLYVASVMESLGFWLEISLNTLSTNGGFSSILRKIVWGKVGIPDKSSSTFLSLTGSLDRLATFDENVKPGDSRYDGAQAMMAAKLAYENEACVKENVTNRWKMEFIGSYDFHGGAGGHEVHAFVMIDTSVDPETIVISFRGMQPFSAREWCSVFDVSWYDISDVGVVHAGFLKAMGIQNTGWAKDVGGDDGQPLSAYYFLRRKLKEILQERVNARFVVTGHSSGGALALMFVAILAIHGEELMLEKLRGVYTFGQPRVGDLRFGEFMMKQFDIRSAKYFRYVCCNNIAQNFPICFPSLPFEHFGKCLLYNSFYQAKGEGEGWMKKGLWLSGTVYTLVSAAWGVMTRFTVRRAAWGGGCRQGWVQKVVRSTGFLPPPWFDPTPQEYTNLTQLGLVPAAS